MRVKELNQDEIIELKQRYYSEKHNNASYGELANINELVSDDEIYSAYDYVEFTSEDFFCNDNTEEKEYENSEEL